MKRVSKEARFTKKDKKKESEKEVLVAMESQRREKSRSG